MSDILYVCEKEEIIEDTNKWIELRAVRNELEHDYPDELEEALEDLRYCVDNFSTLESYFINFLEFGNRYIEDLKDEIIK